MGIILQYLRLPQLTDVTDWTDDGANYKRHVAKRKGSLLREFASYAFYNGPFLPHLVRPVRMVRPVRKPRQHHTVPMDVHIVTAAVKCRQKTKKIRILLDF